MENPIKIDDFGVPLFLETPIWTLVFAHISTMRKPVFKQADQVKEMKVKMFRAIAVCRLVLQPTTSIPPCKVHLGDLTGQLMRVELSFGLVAAF